MAASHPTLVKPPPVDASKTAIENALELTELSSLGPDVFTNARKLYHPVGARGIFGGCIIAQTLAAAQRTVPTDFAVHSYHCFFILAGDVSIPIVYHVERVREGRSLCTRTVQARQKGQTIFTVTCSFMRVGSDGKTTLSHAATMPEGVPRPPDDWVEPPPQDDYQEPSRANGAVLFDHFKCARNDFHEPPEKRKIWQWVKARGKISEKGGMQAHMSALAFLSDSWFLATVARVHRLHRFPLHPEETQHLDPEAREEFNRENNLDGKPEVMKGYTKIGMIVSLDHSIFFHNPQKIRADEWLFTEMESPWASNGLGLVTMKIFSKDGTLLATASQEGIARLSEPKKDKKSSKL